MSRQQGMDLGVFGARGIPSTYSGYETFLTVLLPELAARGHRVTMYCRRGYSDEGDLKGFRRVLLPSIETKELGTLSHGLVASASSRLSRHDLVFVVNVANALFTLGTRATGRRVVLNTDGQEWLRGKWGPAGRRYFWLSARMAGLASSALVTDCQAMRVVYREQFGADSTVIPYCWTGIDGQARPDALTPFGVRPREYFLVAGRLVPENNIDRVVDAYAASGVRLPIVVLGAANYASPVERRLRAVAAKTGGVVLGGHVADRSAYAALVGQARAYVHAHSVGGINPSLLEAMGCGARVVALSTVFNREALGEAGSYFDDFEEQLPAVLRRLAADDPHGDDHLRGAARQRVQETFGLGAVADAYERLFRAVAQRPAWATTTVRTAWDGARAEGGATRGAGPGPADAR